MTDSVTNITQAGATFNAYIANHPSDAITSYGFEWFPPAFPQNTGRVEFTGTPDGNSFSHTVTNNLVGGKLLLKAFAKTKALTIYGASIKFNSLGSAPPRIISFTPTEGFDGSEVTLTVDNLIYDPATTRVTMQNLPVQIISGSDTQLKIKVPLSSLAGRVRFTVQDKANASTAPGEFKVLAPAITVISKTSGRVGERISVTGEHFDSAQEMDVYFGPPQQFDPKDVLYKVLSPTQMDVYVPDRLNDGKAVNIQINSSLAGKPRKTTVSPSAFTVVNSWNRVSTTTPLGNVEGYSSVSIGDLIYVVGGSKLYTFNPVTKEWIKKADFPGPVRTYAATFESGGKLYFGFGEKSFNGVNYNDLWTYDPASNQWNFLMNAPIQTRSRLVAVTLGSKAYIGFGYSNNSQTIYYRDLWSFDPADKSWTSLSNPVATPGLSNPTGFAINGKVYILLVSKEMWEYNPSTAGWTPKKSISMSSYSLNPAVVIGSSAIVFGGSQYGGANNVYQYDPSIDQWHRRQTISATGRRGETAAFANGKVYYGLGANTNANSYTPDFWELTLED
jgi:N-acetylneuraminic acid mutarotase